MHAQGTAMPSGQGTAQVGSARTGRIAYTVAEVAALLGKHSNTIYIPKWALARLISPTTHDEPAPAAASAGAGGELA